MEFGDIIYFILLVFFVILGFFNDSRKKKNQEKRLEEEAAPPYSGERKEALPPVPPRPFLSPTDYSGKEKKEKKVVFQSSMNQASDYKKYDSGDRIEFDYDLNSFDNPEFGFAIGDHPIDPDSPDIPVESRTRRTSDGKNRGGVHPFVADLQGEDAVYALKKGIIYSEIIQRRY